MGHFDTATKKPTGHVVPVPWVAVNGQVQKLVNTWSRRNDLLATVYPGTKENPAACYYPLTASIEVDILPAFGEFVNPALIGDFTDRATHFDWPKAVGAILHEAYHAKYSSLQIIMTSSLNPNEHHWFTLMEEPRIEGLAVYELPENREFLRACALGIVLADVIEDAEQLKKQTRAYQAAHTAILSLGRVDAGVLDKSDVKKIKKYLVEVLGKELLEKLRVIWREFLTLDTVKGYDRMLELSIEFNDLIEERSKQEQAEDQEKNGEPGEGGKSQPGFDPGDLLDKMIQAMQEDEKESSFDVDDMINQLRMKEKAQAAEREREEQRAEQNENKRQAQKTFQFSNGETGRSRSTKIKSREPNGAERATANTIAEAMKKARYRDRMMTPTVSEFPPGRLRTNQAMQATAVHKRGGTARVQPWKYKQRHHVEDPNLTVGIMCDISGSMSYAMEPVSVASWVIAEAVRRINGTAATVYFGADVFPTLKPKEVQKTVDVYDAADGVEEFNKGFRALDGALNLLNGDGARLLVVCSDGQYGGSGQLEACIKHLSACRDNGVAVIWLDNKDSYVVQGICEKTGAHQVVVGENVTAAADAIGQACIKALNAASR